VLAISFWTLGPEFAGVMSKVELGRPKCSVNFCHSAIQRKILTLCWNQEAEDCFRKYQMQMSVNKSIKSFILMVKPELVISGHLHENARKEDEIGKIKILKCWAFW